MKLEINYKKKTGKFTDFAEQTMGQRRNKNFPRQMKMESQHIMAYV
jgi:hypothetical protein